MCRRENIFFKKMRERDRETERDREKRTWYKPWNKDPKYASISTAGAKPMIEPTKYVGNETCAITEVVKCSSLN